MHSPSNLNRRRFLAGTGGAGVAAFLAACGGGGSGGGEGGASGEIQQGATAQAGTSKPQPKLDGHLNVAFYIDANYDPHLGTSGVDHQRLYQVYDTLTNYDQKGVLDPNRALASSWEQPDPTTVVFKLRPGITYHDGTAFNAESVKWNLDRILDPANQAQPRATIQEITSVQATDGSTVTVKLSQPSAPLLANLGDRAGMMISRQQLEKIGKDEYRYKPVGTGPFVLKEHVLDAYTTFERNPNYWWKDEQGVRFPYLKSMRIDVIPEDTVRTAALESGTVDIIGSNVGTPPQDVKRLNADPRFQWTRLIGVRVPVFFINHASPPMDNLWFRRAVASAFDRQSFINNFGSGTGDEKLPTGHLPPASWAHDPTIQYYPFDIAKAKEYLQRSGIPADKWRIKGVGTSVKTQEQEFWEASAKQAGIQIEWVPDKDGVTKYLYKRTGDGSGHIYFTGSTHQPDPDLTISQYYREKGAYNSAYAPMPDIEPLVAKAKENYNIEERKKLYSEIQKIAVDQVYSVILCYYGVRYNHAAKKVGNLERLLGGEAKEHFIYLWT
jgi:peptide/nickel transport system substrate-binding protein